METFYVYSVFLREIVPFAFYSESFLVVLCIKNVLVLTNIDIQIRSSSKKYRWSTFNLPKHFNVGIVCDFDTCIRIFDAKNFQERLLVFDSTNFRNHKLTLFHQDVNQKIATSDKRFDKEIYWFWILHQFVDSPSIRKNGV